MPGGRAGPPRTGDEASHHGDPHHAALRHAGAGKASECRAVGANHMDDERHLEFYRDVHLPLEHHQLSLPVLRVALANQRVETALPNRDTPLVRASFTEAVDGSRDFLFGQLRQEVRVNAVSDVHVFVSSGQRRREVPRPGTRARHDEVFYPDVSRIVEHLRAVVIEDRKVQVTMGIEPHAGLSRDRALGRQ